VQIEISRKLENLESVSAGVVVGEMPIVEEEEGTKRGRDRVNALANQSPEAPRIRPKRSRFRVRVNVRFRRAV